MMIKRAVRRDVTQIVTVDEEPRNTRPINVDRRSLEKASGLLLYDDATALHVVELVQIYFDNHRRTEAAKRRVRRFRKLRMEGRDLSREAETELLFHDNRQHPELTDRKWPLHTLTIAVHGIEEVLRERGGRNTIKANTTYDKVTRRHEGALIKLFDEICDQIGIPKRIRPKSHTMDRARRKAMSMKGL